MRSGTAIIGALLLSCTLSCGDDGRTPVTDTADAHEPEPVAEPASDPEPEPECVVEIDGRCFNYDPRETHAPSAYERGRDVLSAGEASGRETWTPQPDATDDLELAFARVCVSEEGWWQPTGWAALWQVVGNVRASHCDNGRLHHQPMKRRISQCEVDGEVVDVDPDGSVEGGRETLLSALRRLAPHATGWAAPVRSRQRWTSTLGPNADAPSGWVECVAEGRPRGCHGQWAAFADRWDAARAEARRVMARSASPCPAPVIAWGGNMDIWIAEKRDLASVECGDVRNHYFARESAVDDTALANTEGDRDDDNNEDSVVREDVEPDPRV